MRKQVPFKVSLRQPVRTLVFVLLVGLASFGFVARAVEYIILDREMNRIEEFYRTVGTLVPIDPMVHNNVYEAASIVRNSPYIAFEDRRTIVQGVMHDVMNTMRGQHTFGGSSLIRGENPFSYKGLYPFDTIMIVEVESIWSPIVTLTGDTQPIPVLRMRVRPQEVLHGHSQFVVPIYMATFIVDENGGTKIDHLEVGEQYLVRAIRQTAAVLTHPDSTLGYGVNIDFFPLYDDVYFVNISDEDAMTTAMSNMAASIAILDENSQMLMLTGTRDMTALPFVQTGLYQRFQGRFITEYDYINANPVIVIPQGLDRRRPGARLGETITLTLRDMRTFTDGAVITEELQRYTEGLAELVSRAAAGMSDELRREIFWWALPNGVEAHWRNFPAGYWVGIPGNYDGDWQSYPTIEIEVEVIGTYVFTEDWYSLPRWQHLTLSYREIEAFVPASIIPEGWGIVDAHMVSGQYSFLLASPGDDIPFMAAHGRMIEDLGFAVQFLGEDPTNFLLSAVPIRNAIFINMLLFVVVLALVLVLTVFMYLRQRYKEFAILRCLGVAGGSATWQVMLPVLIFWVPIVIIASISAWFFALAQASASLQVLAEISLPMDYGQTRVIRNVLDQLRYDEEMTAMRATAQLDILYLIWMCVGLVCVWLGVVLVGTLSFARKSMISLIQSASGGASVRTVKETAVVIVKSMKNGLDGVTPENAKRAFSGAFVTSDKTDLELFNYTAVKVLDIGSILLVSPLRSIFDAAKSSVRHHKRHILRAPIKTVLVMAVAFLFVVTLGWLDNTIKFTTQEIDRLYSTTVITGEIVVPGAGIDSAIWGHDIPPTSIEIVTNSGFVANYHTTALTRIGLFPAFEHAEAPEAVRRVEQSMLSIVKTISDLDVFIQEATRPVAFGLGMGRDFEITFAEGADSFTYVHGEAIPIIVHESLLDRNLMLDASTRTIYYMDTQRMLTMGDDVYLLTGNAVAAGMGGWAVDEALPATIVGVYSGGHSSTSYRMGQGLILVPDVHWTNFSTVAFTLEQEKLRYLREFEEEMNELLVYTIHHEVHHPGGFVQTFSERIRHELVLNDAEFRMVIIPLEENLNLLSILYPVAKIMSFVLALGLCLLLMLPNAKNIAIMRVLGSSSHKTRASICTEQLAVFVFGVVNGLVAILVFGVGIATAGLLFCICFGGALIGTVLGCIVISAKSPMELLQVRE